MRGAFVPVDHESSSWLSTSMVLCYLCAGRNALLLEGERFRCRDEVRCQRQQEFLQP